MLGAADNVVPEEDPRGVLAEALATAAPCALRWATEPGGALARACRAVPEALVDDAFEIRCGGSDGRSLRDVAQRGGKVLATIRRGGLDVMFVVPVLEVVERETSYALIARLGIPDELQVSARRGLFRVEISPADVDVDARVWQIVDRVPLRDRPKPSQERTCTLHDLSGGGARMTLAARHGAPVTMRVGDRVRIDLTVGGRLLCFDGRVRHVADGDAIGQTRCGVEFTPHEHEISWHQDVEFLHHVLAELQRRVAYRRATAA